MEKVFLELLNVSITASWVVLAVLILRLLLKKTPKWISCVLWALVGLRLIWPFSLESSLSLIPSVQTLPEDIALSRTPEIQSGIAAVDKVVNPVITESFAPQGLVSINPLQVVLWIAALAWLVGVGVMVLYCVISSVRLYRSTRPCVQLRENIYCCDNIDTPFILGVLRPRIYLPSGMDPGQTTYVIAHEKAHLKRRDHWWKPLGYLLLSIYWFNPLLWVAYILLCQDIELACDEKVIHTMDGGERKAYSEALVACSFSRRTIMACPLAFGEVGVKQRIKAVLNYKKPAFWLICGAIAACGIVAVCFLTDPKPCEHVYQSEITLEAACNKVGVQTFTCTDCGYSYTQPVERLAHTYGEGAVLTASTCTKQGSQEFICTVCGGAKTEALALAEHTYGESAVTKQPNCSETGEKTAACEECQGVFVIEVLEKNDTHDMKNEVIRAATCAEDGEERNTCTRCGQTESVAIAKLEHSYTKKMELPATCSRGGQKQMVCDHCGKEQWYDTSVDPDAHHWVWMGYYWPEQCMYCGKTKSDSQNKSSDFSLLDGVTYQKDDSDTQPPVVQWAPGVGGDPNDFSWLYP